MARVQLVLSDEERDRFVNEARREGVTLSEWIRTAARQRLEEQQRSQPFELPADLEAFFRACDAMEGPAREPEWNMHLAVIEKSRRSGISST